MKVSSRKGGKPQPHVLKTTERKHLTPGSKITRNLRGKKVTERLSTLIEIETNYAHDKRRPSKKKLGKFGHHGRRQGTMREPCENNPSSLVFHFKTMGEKCTRSWYQLGALKDEEGSENHNMACCNGRQLSLTSDFSRELTPSPPYNGEKRKRVIRFLASKRREKEKLGPPRRAIKHFIGKEEKRYYAPAEGSGAYNCLRGEERDEKTQDTDSGQMYHTQSKRKLIQERTTLALRWGGGSENRC